MEKENMEQNDTQISGEEIVSQEGTNEYRVYEHPLLPKRIVKMGVCWPALIVGPAYLIYRRLWIPIVVWMVAIGLVRYFARLIFPQICLDSDCFVTENDDDNMANIEIMVGLAIFIGMLLLWRFTNSMWEKDLINRGYIMTKSLRARSMDDALAILARDGKPHMPSA